MSSWDKVEAQRDGEPLSAGLCDNCKQAKMHNTGGNNVIEPAYMELYCPIKKFIIEPLPVNEQIKECDSFIDNRINFKDK